MTSHRPPPIEPLSDIAWARVERDLWAALDATPAEPARAPRRHRPWLAIAAGVTACAAAAAAAVALWPDAGRRDVTLPSRVVTAAAPTSVSFGDAEITIASESALILNGSGERGVDIVLERGAAEFAVAPRAGRPPFVVHAGAADVRVVGTRFTVTRSGDAARVDVAHGKVEVVAHGRRQLLLAGETWDSGREREAASRSSATSPNPSDVAAAHLSVEAAPAEPPTLAPPTSSGRAPAAPTAMVDARAQFEAAAALESSDPAAAAAAYQRLARGQDRWAANALYAGARLALDRGDPATATRLARRYLARFPRGANAADAALILHHARGATP